MSVSTYSELLSHLGHKIVVATYGDNNDAVFMPPSVAIECETCGVVLLDFNHPDWDEESE